MTNAPPRPTRRHALLASLTFGGAALTACRPLRYARAATRSTPQFLKSPDDARVFYEPGAEAAARVVAAAMPTAIATVERMQFGPFEIPVQVYLCATIDSLVSYGASARAGGHTINHRVFLSPKPENTAERLPRVLTHELSHLHLGQKRSVFSGLPVWFVEGLAVEVSGGGGAEGVPDATLSADIAAGHVFVPDVEEERFSGRGASAYGLDEHVFYGEAGLFVAHLRARAPERFATFLRAVEGGATLDTAYEAANGHPLDVAWREFVTQQSARAAETPGEATPARAPTVSD